MWEMFHWSKKLWKTEKFSFNLNIRVPLESVNLFLHVFLCLTVILTMQYYIVTHKFHLKTRNILELTACLVKFGSTCPSFIFSLTKQLMPSQSTERKKSWHSQTRLVSDWCRALVNSFLNTTIVTTCPYWQLAPVYLTLFKINKALLETQEIGLFQKWYVYSLCSLTSLNFYS